MLKPAALGTSQCTNIKREHETIEAAKDAHSQLASRTVELFDEISYRNNIKDSGTASACG